MRSRNKRFLEGRLTLLVSRDTSASETPFTSKIILGDAGLERLSDPAGCCKFIRHEIDCDRLNTDDLNSWFTQINAAIAEGDSISAAQAEKSEKTDKPVEFGISQDRLIHFAALVGDPQVVSRLIDQCSGCDAGALTGIHVA